MYKPVHGDSNGKMDLENFRQVITFSLYLVKFEECGLGALDTCLRYVLFCNSGRVITKTAPTRNYEV